MTVEAGSVHVIVPDKFGCSVVDVAALVNAIMEAGEDDMLDDILNNCAFDQGDAASLEPRVRRLNEDGDANAYWDLSGG